MTRRLTIFGLYTLIGLSLGLLKSCILIGWDDDDPLYTEEYINDTQSDIQLVYTYFNGTNIIIGDTISILAQDSIQLGFAYNGDKPIEGGVNSLGSSSSLSTIELHADGEVKKVWKGPAGYFGDSINSPFNYDSWVFEEGVGGNESSGKITFTITDADLD